MILFFSPLDFQLLSSVKFNSVSFSYLLKVFIYVIFAVDANWLWPIQPIQYKDLGPCPDKEVLFNKFQWLNKALFDILVALSV